MKIIQTMFVVLILITPLLTFAADDNTNDEKYSCQLNSIECHDTVNIDSILEKRLKYEHKPKNGTSVDSSYELRQMMLKLDDYQVILSPISSRQ